MEHNIRFIVGNINGTQHQVHSWKYGTQHQVHSWKYGTQHQVHLKNIIWRQVFKCSRESEPFVPEKVNHLFQRK